MKYSLLTLFMLVVVGAFIVLPDVTISFCVLLPIIIVWIVVEILLKKLPTSICEAVDANQQLDDREAKSMAIQRESAAQTVFRQSLYIPFGIIGLICSLYLLLFLNGQIEQLLVVEESTLAPLVITFVFGLGAFWYLKSIWLNRLNRYVHGIVCRNVQFGGTPLNPAMHEISEVFEYYDSLGWVQRTKLRLSRFW